MLSVNLLSMGQLEWSELTKAIRPSINSCQRASIWPGTDRRIDFHARAKLVSVALRIEPKIMDAEFACRPISITDIVIDEVKSPRQADVHDVRMSASACGELEELGC